MDFNSYVFPIPESSYSVSDFKSKLVWIPKKESYTYNEKIKYQSKSLTKTSNNINNFLLKSLNSSRSVKAHRYSSSMIQKIPSISFSFDNKFKILKQNNEHIPCLFIKSEKSKKILIYFHANYEDLGLTHHVCVLISRYLKINVLSVEYPKYGIYTSKSECTSEEIEKDADCIYKFLTEIMSVEEANIIVLGRCIGSGPATYLAEKYNPGCLVLISAFKSIKAAVKSIFDKFKFGWLFEKIVSERYNN
jgi:hypothetical protein